MAVTWFITKGKDRLDPIVDKASLLREYEGQQRVTIGAGITCAFLGDERNLREYLVAADAVRVLKQAGHIVSFLVFDDSFDALTPRQLRVAAGKDPVIIEKYQHFCGMPICDIPSPDASSHSWADHFEKLTLRRLAKYECYPTLESTSNLYESGAYDPFVKIVLERGADIKRLLDRDFPEYTPQALYYPVCPACGHIKGTSLRYFNKHECVVECENCHVTATLPSDRLRGKMNWKIDCAARWRLFNVDAEPFTKAYLEPTAGAFWIARAIAREFFGSSDVHPILIGVVKVDASLHPSAMSCLPSQTLTNVFTERWNNDLQITQQRLLLAASKPDHPGDISYLDKVKRNVPHLKVRGNDLTADEYAFLKNAETFQQAVLKQESETYSSVSTAIDTLSDSVLYGIRMLLGDAVHLRGRNTEYDHFDAALKFTSSELGPNKNLVHAAVRELLSHRKGLPLRRLIYTVPLTDLELLLYAIERTLDARGAARQLAMERVHAVVSVDVPEAGITRLV